MSNRGDQTAYASNWRTVLAVDALVGVLPLVLGLVLLARRTTLWGALLVTVGAAYVVLVARRALRWKRLRADAGLIPRRRRG